MSAAALHSDSTSTTPGRRDRRAGAAADGYARHLCCRTATAAANRRPPTQPAFPPRPSPSTQPAERKPDFTVGTLRKAIPAHCWERSAAKSFAYLAADLAALALMGWASTFIDAAPVPPAVRWLVLWPLYWCVPPGWRSCCGGPRAFQGRSRWAACRGVRAPRRLRRPCRRRRPRRFFAGAVATGCWVIGHECGHQAFSESQALNDGVGLVVHSLLLVPYYSW